MKIIKGILGSFVCTFVAIGWFITAIFAALNVYSALDSISDYWTED